MTKIKDMTVDQRREYNRKQVAKWRAKNLTKAREIARKASKRYRESDIEKSREQKRVSQEKWRAKNPEKHRYIVARSKRGGIDAEMDAFLNSQGDDS
jgi:hypothetical protein